MPSADHDHSSDHDPTARAEMRKRGNARRRRPATHLVDRAVDWARRVRDGESQARILRSLPAPRRPSRGYASVVVRLGEALLGVPPLELELYRSPRLTFKVAQRVVRRDRDVLATRQALREAILAPTVDGRRARDGRRGNAPDRRGARVPSVTADPNQFTWYWDAAAAEADPLRYAKAYSAHLIEMHRAIGLRLRAVIARRSAPPIPLAGQSIRALARSIDAYRRDPASARARPMSLSDSQALDLVRQLDALLAHRARETDDEVGS